MAGAQNEGIDGGGYDIDTGHKASMTKMLDTTSIKYANVRTCVHHVILVLCSETLRQSDTGVLYGT